MPRKPFNYGKHKFAKQMLKAGLPLKAIEDFVEDYYDRMYSGITEIKIFADPYVEGTFAMRVVKNEMCYYRQNNEDKVFEYVNEFDLLWNQGAFDEVEFESFPPTCGPNNLQFFI
jgi:hypothetical protein